MLSRIEDIEKQIAMFDTNHCAAVITWNLEETSCVYGTECAKLGEQSTSFPVLGTDLQ